MLYEDSAMTRPLLEIDIDFFYHWRILKKKEKNEKTRKWSWSYMLYEDFGHMKILLWPGHR